MRHIIQLFNSSRENNAASKQQCNYANNYYGDQVCQPIKQVNDKQS